MTQNIEAIKDLAKYCLSGKAPVNFSLEIENDDIEGALRKACRELAPDRYAYERNKTWIFEIIQTAIDEVLPKKVLATVGQFAEIRQFGNQQIPRFQIKRGRNRAKQFVTKAALSGIYETFRMDTSYVDVDCVAYGGAAGIDWERYINGEEDFGEYAAIMMEGLEEAIYKEIYTALIGAAEHFSTIGLDNNYAELTGGAAVYNATDQKLVKDLCTVASRYGNGTGAVIFSTSPVLEQFINDTSTNFTPNAPASDAEEIKQNGLIGKWKGVSLVELPNSFTDETNKETVFQDGFGFVFPIGRDTKVVKIALEGPTQVDDFKNRDRSLEIQAYKKFGVAILTYNDWCMFRDLTIAPKA